MTELEKGMEAFDGGDYLIAFHVLQPLAVSGDRKAEVTLGYMFEKGLGVPQHYGEARTLYSLASKQSDAWAEFKAGEFYHKGWGCRKDHVKARGIFITTAKRGIAAAKYYLGVLYEYGQDVAESPAEAHMWYNLAASNGYEDAIESRDRIAEGMNSIQIAKAQHAALDWFYQNSKDDS